MGSTPSFLDNGVFGLYLMLTYTRLHGKAFLKAYVQAKPSLHVSVYWGLWGR